MVSLTLVTALVSLLAIRPDADDVSYISRTLWFIGNPDIPMDLAYHQHALLDREMVYPLILPYTIEHFWGLLAFVSGTQYLDIYHKLVPIMAGAFLPVAWYMALSRFVTRPIYIASGVSLICAWLIIDGQSHQSMGNFAFVRIWQGKAILLSIITPLIIAFSIDWFRCQNIGTYIRLLLLCISGVGLTATSLFFFPVMFFFLFAGFLTSAETRWTWLSIKKHFLLAVGYFSALLYIFPIGLYIKMVSGKDDYYYLGFDVGFPKDFYGQWAMVFGKGISYSPLILATCCVIAIFFLDSKIRRFLFGWLIAAFLIVFNPISMPYVSKWLTSDNAYWRLLYSLPFLLSLGLTGAFLAEKAVSRKLKFLIPTLGFVAVVAVNLMAPKIGVLSKVHFDFNSHKVLPDKEASIQEIISKGKPGPMLAPLEFSEWIPIYSNLYPQLSDRHIFLPHFARLWNQTEMANSRMRAERYVSGVAPEYYSNFLEQLNIPIRNVILSRIMRSSSEANNALLNHGFSLADNTTGYSLYVR